MNQLPVGLRMVAARMERVALRAEECGGMRTRTGGEALCKLQGMAEALAIIVSSRFSTADIIAARERCQQLATRYPVTKEVLKAVYPEFKTGPALVLTKAL